LQREAKPRPDTFRKLAALSQISIGRPKTLPLSLIASGFHPLQFESIWFIANGMNKNYVIQWKSKVNGRAGRGTKLFSREEAEKLVAELNTEYPQIHHEVFNTHGVAKSGSLESPPDMDLAPASA
jgi:hypothetical protein